MLLLRRIPLLLCRRSSSSRARLLFGSDIYGPMFYPVHAAIGISLYLQIRALAFVCFVRYNTIAFSGRIKPSCDSFPKASGAKLSAKTWRLFASSEFSLTKTLVSCSSEVFAVRCLV